MQAAPGGLRGVFANATQNTSTAPLDTEVLSLNVSQLNGSLAETVSNLTEEGSVAPASLWWRPRNIMTLYHTTSPEIARLILKEGFKPGRGGWCGGAIYFINHPHLPRSKFNPVTTKTGAIIQARVDMGRMARMNRKCDASFGHGVAAAVHHGYDSATFNPGDGDEYVILSTHRVISVRRYQ